MAAKHGSRWWVIGLRAGALAGCVAGLTACVQVQALTREISTGLHSTLSRSMHYRLAGADPAARRNLDQGLARLSDGNPRAAVAALNRALWDIERLEPRPLRLRELTEVHDALARAYTGLDRPRWAAEQQQLADRLRDASRREAAGTWPQSMARARGAYLAAQFPEALGGWRDVLVDLEDVADARFRLRHVERMRCFLALTHFALGDEARARDELQRLAALDASVAGCGREAPPSVRVLISEAQRQQRGLN
jgi:hypothetical protein